MFYASFFPESYNNRFSLFRLEQQRPNVTKSDHLRIDKLKDDQSSSGFGLGSKMNRSHSTPDLAQVCY